MATLEDATLSSNKNEGLKFWKEKYRMPKYMEKARIEEIFPQIKYYEEISAGLQDSWNSSTFVDVDVVVENKTFSCHRIVLSAMSHYFKTMFSSGFKESGQKAVTLKGIDADTFGLVLSYIYSGLSEITDSNVYQLLQASSMLQINGLLANCDAYLQQHLTADNCIGIWKYGSGHGLKELTSMSWKYIMVNFPEVVKGDEFLLMEKCDLISLVIDEDLFVPNEEFVCDAVLKWCKYDFEKRKKDLSELFMNLSFPLMDLDYLCNIRDCSEIEDVKDCMSIVLKAIDQVNQGNVQDNVPKSLFRKEEVLCMVGTRSREPNPQKTEVQCFSIRHEQKFKFSPLPKEPGPCVAVCTLGQDIYLSGGYNQKDLILHFESEKNNWSLYEKKMTGRWSHAMVAVDNCIYLVAGMSTTNQTISSIEKFDPETKTCTYVGELKIPVSSMTATVVGSTIYTFGGKNSNKEPVGVIQSYDTSTNKSAIVGQLPADCAGVIGRAVHYENRIILVFRNGSMVEFSQGGEVSKICTTEDFDHFGAVNVEAKVLILGIRSGTFCTLELDPSLYDIKQVPTKFQAPMCNFHCLRLVVSKKFLHQKLKN